MALTKQRWLRVERLEDRALPSASFVPEWNELLLGVQQARAQGNQQAARSLAIMGAAVYDSVNAIDPTHTVYRVDARAFPGASGASADAAAAQAAHDVAYALYTQQAERDRFDSLLTTQLAEVPDGRAETDGVKLGAYVAAQMLAWRAGDGSGATVTYTVGTQPGDWQPTPPNFSPTPATPQWPGVTPFALGTGSQFRPGPPPALTSAEYAQAFDEVQALGSLTSDTRTAEQTEVAFFWAGVGVSNAGVMIWNRITQTVAASHDLTLAQNARLFALVSVANADAFIAGFDAKYAHDFWRPVTAIRTADADGNPDTAQDSGWTPLVATPNHPAFVSLHSTQSRAAAGALAAFFGTDRVGFTATWNGVERSFAKFSDAAKEAGRSRVYAGIHWSFDSAAGLQLGRKVGEFVADHFFQPLTEAGGVTDGAVAQKGRGGAGSGPLLSSVEGHGAPGVFIAPAATPAPGRGTHADPAAPKHPAPEKGTVFSAASNVAPAPAAGNWHDGFGLPAADVARSTPFGDEWSVGPWAQV